MVGLHFLRESNRRREYMTTSRLFLLDYNTNAILINVAMMLIIYRWLASLAATSSATASRYAPLPIYPFRFGAMDRYPSPRMPA